jgi:hypothetical protein
VVTPPSSPSAPATGSMRERPRWPRRPSVSFLHRWCRPRATRGEQPSPLCLFVVATPPVARRQRWTHQAPSDRHPTAACIHAWCMAAGSPSGPAQCGAASPSGYRPALCRANLLRFGPRGPFLVFLWRKCPVDLSCRF